MQDEMREHVLQLQEELSLAIEKSFLVIPEEEEI
jgi:hypothetical protein